jgi:hypothetical protein
VSRPHGNAGRQPNWRANASRSPSRA